RRRQGGCPMPCHLKKRLRCRPPPDVDARKRLRRGLPLVGCLLRRASPQLAHRDARHLDRPPSLSGHCGHGPIFIAQRSVANDTSRTFRDHIGSTDAQLASHGIDTLLIAGSATNVCCESTARDTMMLDDRVIMLSMPTLP